MEPNYSIRICCAENSTSNRGGQVVAGTLRQAPSKDFYLSLAVSVLDQVLALQGTSAPFADLLEPVQARGGLNQAGWANELSGYFEDQGYALNIMLSNLAQGKRARSWG